MALFPPQTKPALPANWTAQAKAQSQDHVGGLAVAVPVMALALFLAAQSAMPAPGWPMLRFSGPIAATGVDFFSQPACWLLLAASAALGMKTNLKQLRAPGQAASTMIIKNTLFSAGLILAGRLGLTSPDKNR
ncbi:hypothetical protein [Pseudophaeobacter sp.]|uniref:hypothetical protein n=1 Tax=Pseudophaeobacter sp. TaxID=1971739 RepID=UPI0040589C21